MPEHIYLIIAIVFLAVIAFIFGFLVGRTQGYRDARMNAARHLWTRF